MRTTLLLSTISLLNSSPYAWKESAVHLRATQCESQLRDYHVIYCITLFEITLKQCLVSVSLVSTLLLPDTDYRTMTKELLGHFPFFR